MLFNLARRHICKSVYSRCRGSTWIALQLGEEEKLMRKLTVFDERLYIRVRRVDQPA